MDEVRSMDAVPNKTTLQTATPEHIQKLLAALDQRDAKDAAARFAERYVTRPERHQ